MSAPTAPIQYGQVWVSRDEVMGPMNYLVVSSDAYGAAFGDRRVIAVEVDSRAIYEGTYREPIVNAGTAMLDRLVGWRAPRCTSRSPSSTRAVMRRSRRRSAS